MQGRYGHDKLNTFIWILAAAVYVINLFVRSPILVIVILLLGALAVLRTLSKNITKRLYENNRFVSIYTAVADFFKRQNMKVRDFKTHRYLRCPYCKAQLRLKSAPAYRASTAPAAARILRKIYCFD